MMPHTVQMDITDHPSPNFDARTRGQSVDMLILHYTGMMSAAEALARMCDPSAKVSAHYLIDEDGGIVRLVAEPERAWHAGVAHWAGESDINGRSIGIEIQNPGHEFGYRPFPGAQISAVIALCRDMVTKYSIPSARVLGHSDVAPQRKEDPGELFPWRELAEAGIGLWPKAAHVSAASHATLVPGECGILVERLQADLAALGYEIHVSGDYDGETEKVVTAFQRHYVQGRVTGIADNRTQARLSALLELA